MISVSRRTWVSADCQLCAAMGCPYCQGTGRVLAPVDESEPRAWEHVRTTDTSIHRREASR